MPHNLVHCQNVGRYFPPYTVPASALCVVYLSVNTLQPIKRAGPPQASHTQARSSPTSSYTDYLLLTRRFQTRKRLISLLRHLQVHQDNRSPVPDLSLAPNRLNAKCTSNLSADCIPRGSASEEVTPTTFPNCLSRGSASEAVYYPSHVPVTVMDLYVYTVDAIIMLSYHPKYVRSLEWAMLR